MLAYSLDLRWWILQNTSGIERLPSIYAVSVALSFILYVFLSVVPSSLFNKSHNTKFTEILFIACLAIFIFCSRWPGLLYPMLNVDEAWFISGAMKLLKDPIFWHSVDGGSTGPLNIYPIALPALFGVRVEYASARIIGLAYISTAIVFLYLSLRTLYEENISRIAMIPVVTMIALTTYYDYVHYSSEHLSIVLLSIGLFLVCKYRICRPEMANVLVCGAGIVLGLIPYAKMQALPIACSIFCVFFHLSLSKEKNLVRVKNKAILFILSGLFVTVAVLLMLTIFNIHKEFWTSYIYTNLLFYGSTPAGSDSGLDWSQKITLLFKMIVGSEQTIVLFTLTGLALFSGVPFILGKLSSSSVSLGRSSTFPFIYYAVAIWIAAAFAVAKPGNYFTHYLLFMIIPSGFLIGIFLGEAKQNFYRSTVSVSRPRVSVLTLAIILVVVNSFLQVSATLKTGNPYIEQRLQYVSGYITPVVKSILKYASAKDRMAVWGWASELYVDSGLVQATRDGVTLWQIRKNPFQDYYLERYLEDLVESKPMVFVDVVTPGSFVFVNRDTESHEVFPQIKEFVQNHYHLAENINGIRIYVRNQ